MDIKLLISTIGACFMTAAFNVHAALVTVPVTVEATANIWSSGHAAPESLTGGAGTLSEIINIPIGHDGTLTIENVTGMIDYGPCCAENGADGISVPSGGIGPAIDYRGIAGMDIPRGIFLSGVFLDDNEPMDPSPSHLVINDIGFSALSPDLAQSFFIGDGLTGTGSGSTQIFNIPNNATRLFLGFHDSFNGLPGFFQDNTGSLSLNANFNTIPIPAAVWLFGSGLIGLIGISRRKKA